jgi:hypothetical protein
MSTPATKPTLYEYIAQEKGNMSANVGKFMTKDRDFDFSAKIYGSSKLLGFIELAQYALFIFILYYYSPFNIGEKYPRFSTILSLLVATVYVLIFVFLRENVNVFNDVLGGPITEMQFLKKIVATLILFVLSVFAIKSIVAYCADSKIANLVNAFISILFLIGFLAIIYLILSPIIERAKLNKLNGGPATVMGLLWEIVMYLPCLLILFLDYMRRQFNITTKNIWILLTLEFVLIILFILTPIILTNIATKDGIQLLKGPVYLNQVHNLGSFKQLYADAEKKDPTVRNPTFYDKKGEDVINKLEKKFSYHYAVSGWFYINPQPPNTSSAYTQYTPILSYARKPVLEYNGQLNKLRVRTETGNHDNQLNTTSKNKTTSVVRGADQGSTMVEIFETSDIIYQKWNHIVFNYDGGTMDVFLNGALVGSKGGITPFMTYEGVTGGHQNGINGGLCNIMYYNNPLSQGTISLMYKMLRDKKNPVV